MERIMPAAACSAAAGYFVTLLSALLPFWTKLDATENPLGIFSATQLMMDGCPLAFVHEPTNTTESEGETKEQ